MNIKKLVFGEKCPDMDDPKLSKQRKEFNSYGEKFGKLIRLDKLAGWLQTQWQVNPRRFVAVFLGIMSIMFFWNIYRLVYITANYPYTQSSAVQRVEKEMQKRHLIKGNDNNSKLNNYGK